jgi:SpoVK/Ycf46/Vps4 family AAA+-type ATPase
VVSKYIGETEKNLSVLFATAKTLNAILFFDEADALFARRTEVRDAHDRYSNQEISYVLNAVHQYNGLVLAAAGEKRTLDPAYTRRLHHVIVFA